MKYVQFAQPEDPDKKDTLFPEIVAEFGEPQNFEDFPNQATIKDDDPRYIAYANKPFILAAKLKRDFLLIDVYDREVMRVQRELRAASGNAEKEQSLKSELSKLDAYAVALQDVPNQNGFPDSIVWPKLSDFE
jgi:hypothetical protein